LNAGVESLVRETIKLLLDEHVRVEERLRAGDDAFVPSPVTEHHAASAAARYLQYIASDDRASAALVHDDLELQDEWVAAGSAFRGTIVGVQDRGSGRTRIPVWTIDARSDAPTRFRRGSNVELVGLPARCGRVLAIMEPATGVRRFEVEITKGKNGKPALGIPNATSPILLNTSVSMIAAAAGGISESKRYKVWTKDGPGAWLTHGVGSPPRPSSVRGDVVAELERLQA
jgi:hypothetical protein